MNKILCFKIFIPVVFFLFISNYVSATTNSAILSLSPSSPFSFIYLPVAPDLEKIPAESNLFKVFENTFSGTDVINVLKNTKNINAFNLEISKLHLVSNPTFLKLNGSVKGQIYYFLGSIYAYQADKTNFNTFLIRNAQYYYMNAYKAYKSIDQKDSMALSAIGYSRMNIYPGVEPPTEKHYQASKKVFDRYLNVAPEHNIRGLKSLVYLAVAEFNYFKKEYKEARSLIQKSIDHSFNSSNDTMEIVGLTLMEKFITLQSVRNDFKNIAESTIAQAASLHDKIKYQLRTLEIHTKTEFFTQKIGILHSLSMNYNLLAILEPEGTHNNSSMMYVSQAINLMDEEGLEDQWAGALYSLKASMLEGKGDIDNVIEAYLLAEKGYESTNNYEDRAFSLIKLAFIYKGQDDVEKFENYLLNAFELDSLNKTSKQNQITDLYNLAVLEFQRDNFQQAQSYFTKASNHIVKGNHFLYKRIETGRGMTFALRGDPIKAKEIWGSINRSKNLTTNDDELYYLSAVSLSRAGDLNGALKYFSLALSKRAIHLENVINEHIITILKSLSFKKPIFVKLANLPFVDSRHSFFDKGWYKKRLAQITLNKSFKESTVPKLVVSTGHGSNGITSIAKSPNGQLLATGGEKGGIWLWETKSNRAIRIFNGHEKNIVHLEFSPDNKYLLSTAASENSVRIWNVSSGQLVNVIQSPNPNDGSVHLARFFDDGNKIITMNTFSLLVWDLSEQKILRRIAQQDKKKITYDVMRNSSFYSFLISSNEDYVYVLDAAGNISSWDIVSGERDTTINTPEVKQFTNNDRRNSSFKSIQPLLPGGRPIFVDNDNYLAINASGGFTSGKRFTSDIVIWDIATGKEKRFEFSSLNTKVIGHPAGDEVLLFNNDVMQLYSLKNSSQKLITPMKIWDEYESTYSRKSQYSLDGNKIVTLESNGYSGQKSKIRGWQVQYTNLDKPSRFKWEINGEKVLTFSIEKNLLITGEGRLGGSNIFLRNLETGEKLLDIKSPGRILDYVGKVTFNKDNSLFAINYREDIHVFSTNTKKLMFKYHNQIGDLQDVAFSQNKLAATYSLVGGNIIRLWDLDTKKQIKLLVDENVAITSLNFSSNNKWLATGDATGATAIWDLEKKSKLAQLFSFTNKNWAVIDDTGRYDSNSPGDLAAISWVVPDQPLKALPVEIFIKEYFEPRLLPQILANEQFRNVKSIDTLNRVQPSIKISSIDRNNDKPNQVDLTVQVKNVTENNLDSKAFDLRVFRNGRLVSYAPSTGGEIILDDGSAVVKLENINLPLVDKDTPVNFTAYAFNTDGIKSSTSHYKYLVKKTTIKRIPKAYILSIGVNSYENTAWNLRYAANDARVMSDTISKRIKSNINNKYQVIPIKLISETTEKGELNLATKQKILAILNRLAGKDVDNDLLSNIPDASKIEAAHPNDKVIITFSGHGFADNKGEFYFFPNDIGEGNSRNVNNDILKRALSSTLISSAIRDIDANEMLMVIDACNSAASVAQRGFKPGPMGSRGFGQLAYDKGMRILAASQAEQFALESDLLEHGMLTYALIKEGIDLKRADNHPSDGKLHISEWLRYGEQRVPKLYNEVLKGKHDFSGRGLTLEKIESITNKKSNVQKPNLFDFSRNLNSDLLIDNF